MKTATARNGEGEEDGLRRVAYVDSDSAHQNLFPALANDKYENEMVVDVYNDPESLMESGEDYDVVVTGYGGFNDGKTGVDIADVLEGSDTRVVLYTANTDLDLEDVDAEYLTKGRGFEDVFETILEP